LVVTRTVLLEARNLSCGYDDRPVLQGLDFALTQGEFAGVIGPNGAGKTTLVRVLSGYLSLTAGAVRFNGISRHILRPKERAATIAVVSQASDTVPPYTVQEFVLLGRIPHWPRFQFLEDRRDRLIVQQAIELTGIRHLRQRRMHELSGGELQLVQVARALAQQPQLLLLDEPTAHLDMGHQVQVMDLLTRLNRERSLTVLAVLHDLNLAGVYCDRLLLLHDGRLCRDGSPEDVLKEDILSKVYNTTVIIQRMPGTGSPMVIPVPARP
jgi:iron complex transport system ATP-binding protein